MDQFQWGLSQGETFGTTGLITNGAIVEREIQATSQENNIRLNITNPDFTTLVESQKH